MEKEELERQLEETMAVEDRNRKKIILKFKSRYRGGGGDGVGVSAASLSDMYVCVVYILYRSIYTCLSWVYYNTVVGMFDSTVTNRIVCGRSVSSTTINESMIGFATRPLL